MKGVKAKMKRKSIFILILLISALIVSLPGTSEALLVGASDYTGYRTADPSDPHYGIHATNGWGDATGGYFKIFWVIDYNTSYPKPYKYEYTLDIPDYGGGLSHFIIEVSRDTTRDDFWPDPGDELKMHKEQQGNPDMPSDLYGIKIDASGQTGIQTYIIYSDRAPMWGDLYAKNGVLGGTGIDIYAYNFGFDLEPASSDLTFNDWIVVPDTETVIPEPATLILMFLGMIGLAGVGLKKRSS